MPRLAAVFLSAALQIVLGHDVPYTVQSASQPEFFEPVHQRHVSYDERLEKLFFPENGDFGRMLVIPSFEPAVCLSVHGDISETSIKTHDGWWLVPDQEKTFYLTVTKLDDFDDLVENNDTPKKKIQPRVQRIDRKVSMGLAIAIQRVWGRMLQLTRYPAKSYAGLDGTTYQFSVSVRGPGRLEGQTWSPKRGLPLKMVNIGQRITAFAQEGDRAKLTEEQLIKELRELESKIPKP